MWTPPASRKKRTIAVMEDEDVLNWTPSKKSSNLSTNDDDADLFNDLEEAENKKSRSVRNQPGSRVQDSGEDNGLLNAECHQFDTLIEIEPVETNENSTPK